MEHKGHLMVSGIVLLAFIVCAPVMAQLDMGVSFTSIPAVAETTAEQRPVVTGAHLGYRWWHVCYLSVDSLFRPQRLAEAISVESDVDMLGLANAGVHLRLRSIVAYATAGLNMVYGKQRASSGGPVTLSGANLRAGAGLRFDWWGVNLSGTLLFDSAEEMKQTVADLISSDRRDLIVASLVERTLPSVNLVIYL